MTRQFRIPRPSRKTILLIVGVAVVTLALDTFVGLLLRHYNNYDMQSVGNIYTIGVEAYGGDIVVKNGMPAIEWNTIYLATSTNRSFYVRSKSNVPITLNCSDTNWTYTDSSEQKAPPPDGIYLTLNWTYDNTRLNPDQTIYITLTLTAPSDTAFIDYLVKYQVTHFNFDIHIFPTPT